MGGGGLAFGVLGFIFAMSALAKIRRLEKQLREAGVLTNQAEERAGVFRLARNSTSQSC